MGNNWFTSPAPTHPCLSCVCVHVLFMCVVYDSHSLAVTVWARDMFKETHQMRDSQSETDRVRGEVWVSRLPCKTYMECRITRATRMGVTCSGFGFDHYAALLIWVWESAFYSASLSLSLSPLPSLSVCLSVSLVPCNMPGHLTSLSVVSHCLLLLLPT